MSDLISRQAAIGAIRTLYPGMPFMQRSKERWMKQYKQYIESERALERLPTAEKKGEWIPQDHNYKHGDVSTCLYFAPVCSECGNTGDFKMNYCPNCGAKMEESDGNSD